MMPPNSLCDIIISEHDVIKAIQSMNSNSAPGLDRIHSKRIENVYPAGVITPVYKNNGKTSKSSIL